MPASVYFQTYGCQMNVNDTEIAWSILQKSGYSRTDNITEVCIMYIYGLLNLRKMKNNFFTKASTEENRESIEFKIDENSAKC